MAARRRIGVYSLPSGGAVSIIPSLLDRRALMIGFGSVTPKQIDQGVDLLSEIVDDAIDDPSADITGGVSGAPSRDAELYAGPPRSGYRPSGLPIPPSSGSTENWSLTGKLAAFRERSSSAHGAGRQHLPVSGQRFERRGVEPSATRGGKTLPARPSIRARPPLRADRHKQPPMGEEGLVRDANVGRGPSQGHHRTRSERSPAHRPSQGPDCAISGGSTWKTTGECWKPISGRCLPNFPAPPVLLRSRAAAISWTNPTTSYRSSTWRRCGRSKSLWGAPVDPLLRFRANFYIDGAEPWEEFDWVGQDIRIGGLTLRSRPQEWALRGDQCRSGQWASQPRHSRLPARRLRPQGSRRLSDRSPERRRRRRRPPPRRSGPGGSARRAASSRSGLASAAAPLHLRGLLLHLRRGAGRPQHGARPGAPFLRVAARRPWRCPDCGTEKITRFDRMSRACQPASPEPAAHAVHLGGQQKLTGRFDFTIRERGNNALQRCGRRPGASAQQPNSPSGVGQHRWPLGAGLVGRDKSGAVRKSEPGQGRAAAGSSSGSLAPFGRPTRLNHLEIALRLLPGGAPPVAIIASARRSFVERSERLQNRIDLNDSATVDLAQSGCILDRPGARNPRRKDRSLFRRCQRRIAGNVIRAPVRPPPPSDCAGAGDPGCWRGWKVFISSLSAIRPPGRTGEADRSLRSQIRQPSWRSRRSAFAGLSCFAIFVSGPALISMRRGFNSFRHLAHEVDAGEQTMLHIRADDLHVVREIEALPEAGVEMPQ